MKLRNIFIAGLVSFGLMFSVIGDNAFAAPEKTRTFEEFVKDEKQFAKWQANHDKHIKKVQELKDQRRISRLEYRAFSINPNADTGDISNAATKIVELSREIKNLNKEFIEYTKKEYNVEFTNFAFHKNMQPCFKQHVNSNGMACGMGSCCMAMHKGHGGHGKCGMSCMSGHGGHEGHGEHGKMPHEKGHKPEHPKNHHPAPKAEQSL